MKVLRVCIAIFLLCFSLNTGFACKCRYLPVRKQYKENQIVLTADVIELLDSEEEKKIYPFESGGSFKVKIKVIKKYKGDIAKNTVIELDSGYSDCDIYFRKGKYLLFLYQQNNKYYVRHCIKFCGKRGKEGN